MNLVPSRKLLTSFLTGVLMLAVGWVVTKLGLQLTGFESGMITSLVAVGAGGAAGFVVKEAPQFLDYAEREIDQYTTPAERAEVTALVATPEVEAVVAKLKAEAEYLLEQAAKQVSAGNSAAAAQLVSYANAKLAVAGAPATP